MAEAVLAPEVEQPKEEAVTTPEVTPESTPEVNQEEEELSSILSTFADSADTGPTDGSSTPSDGEPDDPYKGLSPTQIAEKVRQEEAAKQTQYQNSAQRQAYINGIANVVQGRDQFVDEFADRNGLSAEDRKALRDKFNALNGAHAQLNQYDLQQAQQQISQSFGTAYYQGAVQALGKDAADAAYKDGPSWDVFFGRVGEEYAKKHGLVTKKERDAAVSEGQRRALGKLATAMKERGIDIRQFTGEANPNVPPITGGRGARVTTDYENDVAFNEGRITREQWKENADRFRKEK